MEQRPQNSYPTQLTSGYCIWAKLCFRTSFLQLTWGILNTCGRDKEEKERGREGGIGKKIQQAYN